MAPLTVTADEIDLARQAAARVTALIEGAAATHGRALVSLTGGSTPRRLYANLADGRQPWRTRIPWSDVHLFWGDERHVPPDHRDSNYRMARETLLDHIPIPADHVHRIRAEMPAAEAAADYERTLSDVVSGAPGLRDVEGGRTWLFDVMLLGVGEDGHVASIFPGSDLLASHRPYRVAAVRAEHLKAWRITLTPEAILDSQSIVVLVSGERKAAAVRAAIAGPLDVKRCPAQLLRSADGRVEWLLDRKAAALL